MGLFDFVKDAGARLFSSAKPTQPPEEAAKESAEALSKAVFDLNLNVKNLQIDFKDDVVTLRGETPSQADREKVVLAVGNVRGVSRVDDRLTVEKPEPEAVMYTVKPGDTLSKISKAHYGNAMKYMVIFEANKPMLENPDKIYPGQTLRIPSLGE